MVQPRFFQQRKRSQTRHRIGALHRLQVVIEVEQKCFAAARFDKTVGMSVKVGLQCFAFDEMQNVSCEHLGFEMRHRAGLGRGQIGRVTDDKDVFTRPGLQAPFVGRHEVQFVTQP